MQLRFCVEFWSADYPWFDDLRYRGPTRGVSFIENLALLRRASVEFADKKRGSGFSRSPLVFRLAALD